MIKEPYWELAIQLICFSGIGFFLGKLYEGYFIMRMLKKELKKKKQLVEESQK